MGGALNYSRIKLSEVCRYMPSCFLFFIDFLPVIIPLVVYRGRRNWTIKSTFGSSYILPAVVWLLKYAEISGVCMSNSVVILEGAEYRKEGAWKEKDKGLLLRECYLAPVCFFCRTIMVFADKYVILCLVTRHSSLESEIYIVWSYITVWNIIFGGRIPTLSRY